MNSLQQQITGNLTSYVYSDFMMHSLVTTTSIMSGIIGGVLKLPIAKMIDLWGRTEGYIVMVGICTLGKHHTLQSSPFSNINRCG